MAYGLTSAGFVTKPLQTIIAELQADYQTAFGANIDLSNDSNFGVLIGNQAKKFADMWDLLQAVYASFNPDTAEAAQLDQVAAMMAVARLSATASSAYVMLYGVLGTPVPQGHLINQPNILLNFQLQSAITIALANAGDWMFHVNSIVALTAYSVTVNGVVCSYTSGSSDTAAMILTGLLNAIVALVTNTSKTVIGSQGRLYSTDGATPFAITSLDAKLTTDLVGSPGYYLAVSTGPNPVPLGTLTNIVNPISGLASVNNIVQGTSGADIESDAAFRLRRRNSLQHGAGTDSALSLAIGEVSGVTSVTIIDNRTDTYDAVNGVDPHAVLCVVTGGLDAEIAAAIWSVIGAGCNTSGTTSAAVKDANGTSQTVKFSRPANMYVWLNIQCTKYTEETLPTNAIQLIQTALAAWALATYKVGIDVILQRIIPTIYATVPGIKDITITAAAQTSLTPAPSGGSYSASNIAIGIGYIAVILSSNIQVGIA